MARGVAAVVRERGLTNRVCARLDGERAAADVIFALCNARGTVSEARREVTATHTHFAWELRW